VTVPARRYTTDSDCAASSRTRNPRYSLKAEIHSGSHTGEASRALSTARFVIPRKIIDPATDSRNARPSRRSDFERRPDWPVRLITFHVLEYPRANCSTSPRDIHLRKASPTQLCTRQLALNESRFIVATRDLISRSSVLVATNEAVPSSLRPNGQSSESSRAAIEHRGIAR